MTQIAERREPCPLRHSNVISKTIKIFGFNNNTHLFDMSSLDVLSTSVLRTLSNVSDESFFENR